MMLTYTNRVGITIARDVSLRGNYGSTVERYLKNSRLLDEYPEQIRMDVVSESDSEERLIEGIKRMIS